MIPYEINTFKSFNIVQIVERLEPLERVEGCGSERK